MAVTTALLGFRPASLAGHARPAGLQGAGCLVPLRTTRMRRVATAWAPPPQTLPFQAETPPTSFDDLCKQMDVEIRRTGLLWPKIIAVAVFLGAAYLDWKAGNEVVAGAKVLVAILAALLRW